MILPFLGGMHQVAEFVGPDQDHGHECASVALPDEQL